MVVGLTIKRAEELLGADYVIGRALHWRTSKYLCLIAGQRDPSEYWACAVWDDEDREWIEPTLVFPRLSDLVVYYQKKTQQRMMVRKATCFSRHPEVNSLHAAENVCQQ